MIKLVLLLFTAVKFGTKSTSNAPVLESRQITVDLEKLPFLQLWHEDGGGETDAG